MFSIYVIIFIYFNTHIYRLFGRPPFYSEDEEEIYELVSEGKWAFPESNVSELGMHSLTHSLRVLNANLYLARDMIKKLLEKDPNKRITVKQAIAHPFITVSASLLYIPRF